MTQKFDYVSAIDIGTTKIVAIIGKKEASGSLKILGLGTTPSIGVKRGVILNIEEATNSIKIAVEMAEDMAGLKMQEVFVGIAGQHIKSIRNRGYKYIENAEDEILEKDVIDLIEDMGKTPVDVGDEILHVLPQSFIVDSESGIKNPVGMCGKKIEANFHIVIGQIASANNIKKCINRADLEVKELILEPLASSKAVLVEDEKEVGVALVDIGGGTTDVAVYYDGIIRHTAVIPFGGNTVTNDIKAGCAILEKQAEKAKIKFGSALASMAHDNQVVTIPGLKGREPKEISFKTLAHIIQSRMEEIIGAIFFQIESSGFSDKLGAGIVLTGGGALLKHLPQLIAYKTGFDVRLGLPNEYLTSDFLPQINQPMYSTGVGLMLKGYARYEQLDLLSKEEDQQVIETFEEKEIETVQDDRADKISLWKEKIGTSLSNFFEEKDVN